MSCPAIPDQLMALARDGDQSALGKLLDLYRNYLRLVARSLIGAGLRVKLEPSDLVQETFLKAHRDFFNSTVEARPI
jgi:RNA polymerase sigma-70 factor (ECF subfamily)